MVSYRIVPVSLSSLNCLPPAAVTAETDKTASTESPFVALSRRRNHDEHAHTSRIDAPTRPLQASIAYSAPRAGGTAAAAAAWRTGGATSRKHGVQQQQQHVRQAS